MKEKTIKALMVAPGEHPVLTTLCCCKTFLDLAVSFGTGESCEVSFLLPIFKITTNQIPQTSYAGGCFKILLPREVF